MKVTVEVDISNCDDCPFLVYMDYSDNCVLSEEEISYPKAYTTIPKNCPLRNLDRIKYSGVKLL